MCIRDRDGATVYVASEAASLVHVIDVASGAIKADIPVGSRPRRFAQTPDGKEVWVSTEVEGAVYVIDAATSKVTKRIEFTPRGFRRDDIRPVGLKLTADGATAYVTLGAANRVAVVDGRSKEVRDYILVGSRPWDVTLSRDESRLFVANGASDDITIVDTKAGKVIRSVPVGRSPHSVAIDD